MAGYWPSSFAIYGLSHIGCWSDFGSQHQLTLMIVTVCRWCEQTVTRLVRVFSRAWVSGGREVGGRANLPGELIPQGRGKKTTSWTWTPLSYLKFSTFRTLHPKKRRIPFASLLTNAFQCLASLCLNVYYYCSFLVIFNLQAEQLSWLHVCFSVGA